MTKKSVHRDSIIDFYKQGIRQVDISRRLLVAKSVVSKTIARFKSLGSNLDRPGRGSKAKALTKSNVKKVRERLRYNAARKKATSQANMAKDLGISRRSVGRIVKEHLNMKAYKFSKSQFLTDASKKKREDRSKQLLNRFSGNDYQNILFTDEKMFTIEQFVNKQNDRIYSKSQPNVSISRTGHPKSVMVFAGITSDGKTPLIFLDQGIKMNSNNYISVLKKEVLPWAQKHFRKRIWCFQQDGAPAHKARIVQDWCRQNFPDFIDFNQWPPSSPDLNPLDYSVWSVLEAKACSKSHSSVDSLKKSLQKAWEELDVAYLSATVEDFLKRLGACITAHGDLFEKK